MILRIYIGGVQMMKTKNQTRKNKRNYIIVALIVVLLLLAVGYASFTQTLNITGTATASATWNVHFTSASTSKSGTGHSATISADEKTINFTSTLAYPGDAEKITAVITNDSSMGIKLTGFTVTDGTNTVASVPLGTETAANEDILIDYVTLNTSTEKIAAGGSCTYEFVVRWNKESTTVPTAGSPISKSYTITFDYEQDTTDSTLTPSHTH
jgi:hypothetical protein